MDSNRIPNKQTTWKKKPRKTIKKMEWNCNRPPGLILDEYDDILANYIFLSTFKNFIIILYLNI
jgi:hypothetical protein